MFAEAWSLLSVNKEVLLSNLITFLVAIEKIMSSKTKPTEIKSLQNKVKFGAMTDDGVYLVYDDHCLNSIHKHFALFSKNKQLMNE